MSITHTLLLALSLLLVVSGAEEECPEVCEPEKCPNVGPIGLSQCPAKEYIVTYRCGCCQKCDVKPVTTTMSPHKRDEVCKEVSCPKKKVCMLNMQGLPVCKCPTIELCKKYQKNHSLGKKTKVCGSDGVTYASRCHLKVASCRDEGKIRVVGRGECTSNGSTTPPILVHITRAGKNRAGSRRQHTPSNANYKGDNYKGSKRDNNKNNNKGNNNKGNSDKRESSKGNNNKENNKRQNRRNNDKKPNRKQNKRRERNYQRALRVRRVQHSKRN